MSRTGCHGACCALVAAHAGVSSNNYHPIALVSACSKIFESVLLRIIDDYISTHDNQFGFKKRHNELRG